ncbi:DUF3127 domain-containing protein [Bacteroidetes/Chlorobi group bacterium ChocPot_Mid]|jgi:hypothetical protein|nr:MAG: DUF3127 domain-containing protein [Bacteroidetes/Chlorobi group bacterium ChocPot_Mid]
MTYTLTGKLHAILELQNVTGTFQKREFVVETVENSSGREFIELIKFQLLQDKCGIIENYNIGDNIKVSFNIRGRKWDKDGKSSYFTNLDAWRIEPAEAEKEEDFIPPFDENSKFEDDIDDVPF